VVHALGAGLVIAEIQQASDTTYRLFDWNRTDAAGKPRPLHVAESLAVTDFGAGPIAPQQPRVIGPGRERLVECDKFVLERRTFAEPITLGGDGRCHLVAVIGGSASAAKDPAQAPLALGATALLPAAAGPIELSPHGHAVLLDIWLPE
jgi:mannose-6-phosphate isomerase